MKRLCTADWQLMYGDRDRYRTDFVVQTLPVLIEKYKPDQLLVLGDLTEIKDLHPAPLVNKIVNAFYELSQLCEVIVLQGNHDFKHNSHPFFQFVNNFEHVTWISKPTIKDGCLYLPHTRDYKKDWKGIDFTNGGNDYDFIFAHNIFEGVKANGQSLAGIPSSIFPDDATVIAGDVHEPQTLDDGKIIYIGSPCLVNFGDNYTPRVLLLDDLNIKSIKVHGQQKRLIEVFWKDGMQFRRTGDFNPGDIVKIKSYIEMEHVANWARLRDHLQEWATQNNLIVNSIVPIVAYDIASRQKVVKNNKKSDSQYLQTFVGRTGADNKTANVGMEIINLEN
jgi:UDP-2,3-diacylglucosamine pyrophosphatase LpxH